MTSTLFRISPKIQMLDFAQSCPMSVGGWPAKSKIHQAAAGEVQAGTLAGVVSVHGNVFKEALLFRPFK